jgi:hypothetical protein
VPYAIAAKQECAAPRLAVRHCLFRSKCLVKLSFQAQTAVFSKRALRIRSPVTLCSVTFKQLPYSPVASSFLKCFFMTLYFLCTVSLRFELTESVDTNSNFFPPMQWSWTCMCAFQGKMFQGENLNDFLQHRGALEGRKIYFIKNLHYKFTTARTKFYTPSSVHFT